MLPTSVLAMATATVVVVVVVVVETMLPQHCTPTMHMEVEAMVDMG
jgi:hypothetical protein